MPHSLILTTKPSGDYELLDSGDGEKLERYGAFIVARPDPQALWNKLHPGLWKKADAVFTREERSGGWEFGKDMPHRWNIALGDLSFSIRPTAFKHVGLFPEHVGNWDWIREKVKSRKEPVNILNVFGYTGGATLAAAQAGAQVCHVDGSKTAVTWARDNAALSKLQGAPVRWIVDDARTFVRREKKRGNRYDGIIMDPPAFGHGPKKELWKIEKDFVPFLELCREVMTDDPLFFLINGYASGYSAVAYDNNLQALFGKTGTRETGELTIEEKGSGRLLPCGIFARWSA